jgi:hypothetical protein
MHSHSKIPILFLNYILYYCSISDEKRRWFEEALALAKVGVAHRLTEITLLLLASPPSPASPSSAFLQLEGTPN